MLLAREGQQMRGAGPHKRSDKQALRISTWISGPLSAPRPCDSRALLRAPDRHVCPVNKVPGHSMAVRAPSTAANMVLVVQVIHAVSRVEYRSVGIVLAAGEISHVKLRSVPWERSGWAHLVAGCAWGCRAIRLEAHRYIFEKARWIAANGGRAVVAARDTEGQEEGQHGRSTAPRIDYLR